MQVPSSRARGPSLVLSLWVLLAGCAPTEAPPSRAAAPPMPRTQAAQDDAGALVLPDLMAFLVDPAAGVISSAAEWRADSDRAPLTAEAWQAVVDAAVQLAQAGETLAQPALATGRTDWLQWTVDLRESAVAGGAAAARHDAGDLSAAGARLVAACQACHARYASGFAEADPLPSPR